VNQFHRLLECQQADRTVLLLLLVVPVQLGRLIDSLSRGLAVEVVEEVQIQKAWVEVEVDLRRMALVEEAVHLTEAEAGEEVRSIVAGVAGEADHYLLRAEEEHFVLANLLMEEVVPSLNLEEAKEVHCSTTGLLVVKVAVAHLLEQPCE